MHEWKRDELHSHCTLASLFVMKLYARYLSVLIVITYYTGILTFIEGRGGIEIPAIVLSFCFLVASLPLILRRMSLRLTPLIIWCWIYLLVLLLGLASAEDPSFAVSYFAGRVGWIVAIIACTIVFSNSSGREQAIRTTMTMAVLSAFWNLLGFLLPAVNAGGGGRAYGLHLNPNSSGIALVLGMIVTDNSVPAHRRLAFRLLIGAGVLATFSRTAILAWLLAMVIGYRSNLQGLIRPSFIPYAAIAVTSIMFALLSGGSLWEPIRDRISGYGLTSRVEFFTEGSLDNSSIHVRMDVARTALDIAMEEPLFGHGTASVASTPAFANVGGTHNVYLEGAMDYGFFGVLLYLLLPISAVTVVEAKRVHVMTALQYVAVFWFAGLFVQNSIYHLYFMVTLALVAAVVTDCKRSKLGPTLSTGSPDVPIPPQRTCRNGQRRRRSSPRFA